jgi:uncharacterized protein YecE (DUF72 family)
MKKGKVFIVTSGWVYDDWWGRFYPQNIKPEERLEYYSKYFNIVEINSSFYHLPRQKTFKNWSLKTHSQFYFSAKLSRYITQIKKLNDSKEPLELFLSQSKGLGKKLQVILVQLPPNFRKDLKRLGEFLKLLPKERRFAFEFRHVTWLDREVYDLLRKYKAGFVIQDSSRWPRAEVVTADFVYLRLHGRVLYSSNYPEAELKKWAEKIKNWFSEGLDVYGFFNNDTNALAVKNALSLKNLVSS